MTAPLRLLDLFSGIGGFSLGLERSGAFKTVAFCEIEKFPRKVLRKHWPEVPIYEDVRELTAAGLAADGIAVDAICGGFPCQDISTAGRKAGITGSRSGLWFEYARLIGELRPEYVIVENVGALLSRGLDAVLGELATLGYDAEWHCIPASAIGAPHRRDRLWLVGYPNDQGEPAFSFNDETPRMSELVADAIGRGQQGSGEPIHPSHSAPLIQREAVDAFHGGVGSVWRSEPNVGRVANGVPARMDRLKSLGNAVVPQIPEMIGRAIAAARYQNFSTGTAPVPEQIIPTPTGEETGMKCAVCRGSGVDPNYVLARNCRYCGGTGDAHMPTPITPPSTGEAQDDE